jgi:F-type H+-transporting ATPase subunit c
VEFVGLALLYGFAVTMPAFTIGWIGSKAAESTARQPEMAGRIFTVFILGAAFAEALALLGFVLGIIVQGKIG